MARNVDSIGVQKQLNQMFEQRVELENRVLAAMQQELKIAMQLQAVMQGLTADQLVERLNEANQAMADLAAKATETGDIGNQAMASIGEAAKEVSTSGGMMSKTFTGISKVMGGLQSVALGIVGSLFKMGKSLLSIPLGIFKSLMADAAAFSGDTSFMEALEKIRGEFGSFKEETSKNITGAYQTVNTQLQAMSGLSVWQVFKTPADQLKYLHDIATKAGPQIHQFGNELAKSAGLISIYDKGMNIGAENMKSFMNRATVMGTTLSVQLKDTANYALQLGKDFNISSKTISKDVGMMMKDVKNFGSLTQKEMTVASVYTKKLGLEMKDILGVVEKFDNFDKAAESAAMLGQAFGANVDAFKLMNEQDPAKRVDELRKSMAAAGKTSENMTRQELNLLASTSGLTAEAAKLAFSQKNQGVSYQDIEKKAAKAENAQMKQADAMKGLSDNIERVVHAGSQIAGFWKNFVEGFKIGFKMTSEYRGLMLTLKSAMWQFNLAGREVGAMFMKLTPGISESFKTFTAIFSRDKIKKLLFGFTSEFDSMKTRVGGVVGGFKKIFKGDLDDGFTVIKDSFTNFFSSAQIQPILNGITKFGVWLAEAFGEALGTIAKNAPIYIDKLTAFIKDPKGFIDSMKKGGSQANGIFQAMILSFDKGFGKSGPVMKKLKESIEKLLTAAWQAIKESPMVQEAIKDIAMYQIGKMLMGNIGGLLSAGTNIVGMFKKSGDAAKKATEEMTKAGDAASKSADSMSKSAAGAGKMQTAMGGLKAAAVGLGVGLAAYEAILQSGMSTWDASIKKVKEATDMYAKFQEEQKRLRAGGKITKDTVNIANDTDAKLRDNIADAERKLAVFESKAKNAGKYNIGGESLYRALNQAVFEGANNELIHAKAQRATFDEDFKDVEKQQAKERAEYAALSSKTLLAGYTLSPDILAEVEKSHQSLEEKFDKLYGSMDKKGPLFEARRKAYMQKEMLAMGKNIDTQMTANAAHIQMMAEEQARAIVGVNEGAAAMAAAVEEQKKIITAQEMSKAGAGAGGADTVKEDLAKLMTQKQSLEENINGLTKFAEGGIISKLNVSLPKAALALEDFNTKLTNSTLNSAISATAGIVKSMNELGAILSSGDGASMKVGEKLQRFANASGLGKNSSYEIKNKGIMLKLDLKISMDAAEVEKMILFRNESIIFDMIEGNALTSESQTKVNELQARKGGH